MTAIAPDNDLLRELDDDARRAWNAYSEGLRELSGAEYELAESESWTKLQIELRRLDRRRRPLTESSA